MHFVDKRDVYMISTIQGAETVIAERKQKDGLKIGIECPTIAINYNKFMGGVDVADQLFVYYSIGRRGLKWWKKVFYCLLEMSVVNAYLLFKENVPETNITHVAFRTQLAQSLADSFIQISSDNPSISRGRPPIRSLTCLQGKHFPYMQPRRGRCKVCGSSKNTNGKIKDTKVRSYCPKCNVSLCIGNCFELYHTKTAI